MQLCPLAVLITHGSLDEILTKWDQKLFKTHLIMRIELLECPQYSSQTYSSRKTYQDPSPDPSDPSLSIAEQLLVQSAHWLSHHPWVKSRGWPSSTVNTSAQRTRGSTMSLTILIIAVTVRSTLCTSRNEVRRTGKSRSNNCTSQ
jgi:hypothetical protein